MSEQLTQIYKTLNDNQFIQFDNTAPLIISTFVIGLLCTLILIFTILNLKKKRSISNIILTLIAIGGFIFLGLAWYQNYQLRIPYRTTSVQTQYQKDVTKSIQNLYRVEKANYNLNAVKNLNSSQLSDKQYVKINAQLNQYHKQILQYQSQYEDLLNLQNILNTHPNQSFLKNPKYLTAKYPTYYMDAYDWKPFSNTTYYNYDKIDDSGITYYQIDNLTVWQAQRYTDTKLQTQFKQQFNIK